MQTRPAYVSKTVSKEPRVVATCGKNILVECGGAYNVIREGGVITGVDSKYDDLILLRACEQGA